VPYIVLRGHWYNVIVFNVHAPSENKSDDCKDSFYEELEQIFDFFPKYRMKIQLGHCNEKLGRDFQTDNWIESRHQDNDNGVRRVNVATLTHLVVTAQCSHTEHS